MNRLNDNQTLTQALTPCIWMQGGIVDYKLCDRAYDCEQCPLDLALHAQPNRSPQLDKENLNVCGFSVRRGLFFHPQHTWVRIEGGGVVRIGLDDFGQRILGRAYSISLPAPRAGLQSGATGVCVTHQCGCSAITAPVSGRVKDVNTALRQRPSLLNHGPFDEGWLMLIEPEDLNRSLKPLMYGDRVCEWFSTEVEKLLSVIAENAQTGAVTMNDGGRLTQNFISELTGSARKQVIDSFFAPVLDEPAGSNNAIKFPKRR